MQGKTPRSICRADYQDNKKVKELNLMLDAGRDAEVNMQSRLSGKHNKTSIQIRYDTRPFDAIKAPRLILSRADRRLRP